MEEVLELKKKSDFTHGGNLKEFQNKFSLTKEEIIDFSANINFLGIPEEVKEIIKKEIENVIHYPQPQAENFKEQLSKTIGLNKEKIIAGNGAAELIYLLLDYLKVNKILLPVPSFSEYEKAAFKIEAELDFFYLKEEKDFSLELLEFEKSIKGNDLVILNNPHNPTGRLYNRDKLKYILKTAQKEGAFVLIDEAFIDFVRGNTYSLIKEINRFDNLFILRSLTKFFAMPGLRLGFALTNNNLVDELEKRRDPWTVNSLAQAAGIEALKQKRYIKKTRTAINKERQFLYEKLKNIKGIKVYEPSVNFILLRIEKEITAAELRTKMAKSGIIIRNCSNFRGLDNNFVRVAVKDRKANIRLLNVLKNSL